MLNTVIYDGNCNFCIGIAGFLRKKDIHKRLTLVTLQSDEGNALVSQTGLPENETNTVIYFTGKKFFIRSTAVLHILKDLGGAWRIFFIFIMIPEFIRDFIYRFIARNRYRFSGKRGG